MIENLQLSLKSFSSGSLGFETLYPIQVINSLVTENSNMEILVYSMKDENIDFLVTSKNHKEDDEKDGWVNIDGEEINNIFNIIEYIVFITMEMNIYTINIKTTVT